MFVGDRTTASTSLAGAAAVVAWVACREATRFAVAVSDRRAQRIRGMDSMSPVKMRSDEVRTGGYDMNAPYIRSRQLTCQFPTSCLIMPRPTIGCIKQCYDSSVRLSVCPVRQLKTVHILGQWTALESPVRYCSRPYLGSFSACGHARLPRCILGTSARRLCVRASGDFPDIVLGLFVHAASCERPRVVMSEMSPLPTRVLDRRDQWCAGR